MNLASDHVRPLPHFFAAVGEYFLAPVTGVKDISVLERQLCDGAFVFTAPASNETLLIVADSRQVLQSHKMARALAISVVAVGVPRGQSGPVCAHQFCDVWAEHLFFQEALHGPVNGRVAERAALDDDVIAQNRGVGDFQDFVDGVLDHRVGQPGGDVADLRAFPQGLVSLWSS